MQRSRGYDLSLSLSLSHSRARAENPFEHRQISGFQLHRRTCWRVPRRLQRHILRDYRPRLIRPNVNDSQSMPLENVSARLPPTAFNSDRSNRLSWMDFNDPADTRSDRETVVYPFFGLDNIELWRRWWGAGMIIWYDNRSDELIVLMGLNSLLIRIVSEAACRFFSVWWIARFINNLKMSLVIRNRNL